MKLLTTISFLFITFIGFSQNFAPSDHFLVDSLVLEGMYDEDREFLESILEEYHEESSPLSRIVLLDTLVNHFYDEQWTKYNAKLLKDCESLLSNEGLSDEDRVVVTEKLANATSNIGYMYNSQGETALGLEYYHKALEIYSSVNDTIGILLEYNNLSIIYQKIGEFQKAMELKEKQLKLAHAFGNVLELYQVYNNIGYDLLEQKYYQQAIENFEKSLRYAEETKDLWSQAVVLNNLGFCYQELGQDELALKLYYESIDLRNLTGRLEGNVSPLLNIAAIYRSKIDSIYKATNELPVELFDTTQKILEKGLKTAKYTESVSDLSTLYGSYFHLLTLKDDFHLAKHYADSSYHFALKSGFSTDLIDAYEIMYIVNKKLKNTNLAMEMLEKYIDAKEEYLDNEKAEEVIVQNYRLQYEVKSVSDSIRQMEEIKVKNAMIEAEQAEKDSLKRQKYYLFGGLGLVALFGIFMFNRFQVTRRQKNIIDKQREEVELAHEQLEEHHNEIQDSIKYAKRIQEAIMPSMDSMKNALKDGFVLYMPKDVVAGDFYWMEPLGDVVYFAAADCTGHGVPGAMVSVVCSNALNKVLLEEQITDLGKLLDRTTEIVIERLAKSGEEVKDGMDISICGLNVKTKELKWAGANNPLWIIRDGAETVEEYKPNKQPIGKYASSKPFNEHTIQLNSNDKIYVFTDGYQDQFGGPKGKKLKASTLKKILIDSKDLSMNQQKETLHQTIIEWKGSLEQLDDICIIGVRV